MLTMSLNCLVTILNESRNVISIFVLSEIAATEFVTVVLYSGVKNF
jgi:hypothetical protein